MQARFNPIKLCSGIPSHISNEFYDDTVKLLNNMLAIGSKPGDVIQGPLTKYNMHSVPLHKMVHPTFER